MIRQELRNERVHILCVGPAGENRVSVSSIEHGPGASFSRAGIGAVMGDKRLKAIAVHGTKDLNVARPSGLVESREKILGKAAKLRAFVDDWAHTRIHGLVNIGAYGNVGETIPWPDAGDTSEDYLKKSRMRRPSCFNCQVSCRSTMRLPGGEHAFVKCQTWYPFLMACKIQDFWFNSECT